MIRSRARIGRMEEILADEEREASAVIDMGVGEHDGVDGAGREGQFPVFLLGFFAAALKHAAIEENRDAVRFQFVLRSGDAAGRAVKCEFHPCTGYNRWSAVWPTRLRRRGRRIPAYGDATMRLPQAAFDAGSRAGATPVRALPP